MTPHLNDTLIKFSLKKYPPLLPVVVDTKFNNRLTFKSPFSYLCISTIYNYSYAENKDKDYYKTQRISRSQNFDISPPSNITTPLQYHGGVVLIKQNFFLFFGSLVCHIFYINISKSKSLL